MSTTNLQNLGVKIRWLGGKLATLPPLAGMSPEQKAALAAYRLSSEAKKQQAEQFAMDCVADACKATAAFRGVAISELYRDYCERLGNIPPISREVFASTLETEEAKAFKVMMASRKANLPPLAGAAAALKPTGGYLI